MNILRVLRTAAEKAAAKQETATRELQAITAAIGAFDGRRGHHESGLRGRKLSAAHREAIRAGWARRRKAMKNGK